MDAPRCILMRHGLTAYVQGNGITSLADAQDLTDAGVQGVQASTQALMDCLLSNLDAGHGDGYEVHVHIVSSPTGRCLHTAKLVAEMLASNAKGRFTSTITPDARLIEVSFPNDIHHHPFALNNRLPMVGGEQQPTVSTLLETQHGSLHVISCYLSACLAVRLTVSPSLRAHHGCHMTLTKALECPEYLMWGGVVRRTAPSLTLPSPPPLVCPSPWTLASVWAALPRLPIAWAFPISPQQSPFATL